MTTAIVDTHALLWYEKGDPKPSSDARSFLDNTRNERIVSVASLWEMAIKHSIGKLTLQAPFEILIPEILRVNDFVLLNVTVEYVTEVARLAYPESGHRDPFDRLMVSQARVEDIPILSADVALDDYDVTRIW